MFVFASTKSKYHESFDDKKTVSESPPFKWYGCAEKGICGDPCFLLDLYRELMYKQEMELRWFSIHAQMPLFPARGSAPAPLQWWKRRKITL